MARTRSALLSLLLIGIILFAACAPATSLPVNPYQTAATAIRPPRTAAPAFLERPAFSPEQARYFDRVQQTFALTPEELALLQQNGFVVSDRLAFEDFTNAYGYIYWKDLPVVVTTDSLLQSIHLNYDYILMMVEYGYLMPQLTRLLTDTRQEIKAAAQANHDARLAPLYDDLEIYLTVPLALLTNSTYDAIPATPYPGAPVETTYDTPGIEPYLALAGGANQMTRIPLFGGEKRTVDFSLFAPRGHYAREAYLARYFRAMTWLGQVDFRFVVYNPETSAPTLQQEHIAAAMLLREAIDRAGRRDLWADFDNLLTGFVGRSDNMRLPELDTFLQNAGLDSPSAALEAGDDARLLTLLAAQDDAQQRITGQVIYRHIDNISPDPIPRPLTFALMGTRFIVDAYVMSNLVYDRLWVEGQPQPVERALPSPLDVIYALGNDRPLAHLQDELERYGYRENLEALRGAVEELDPEFWAGSAYNRWLSILRTLNVPTTTPNYPQAMRTAAWADKVLHTQLASWAQLRHDNLLYAKQSFTTFQISCSYPDGYVEPYPEFYAAVAAYARAGHTLLATIDAQRMPDDESQQGMAPVLARIDGYFDRLEEVAGRLQGMAEKELRLEPFSAEEVQFIKSVVVYNEDAFTGCGGPTYRDLWTGWYPDLFLDVDKSPALIADVHSNPTNDPRSRLYPPRVLHAATGPVATMLLIVDTDEGPTVYVGPVYTYFEVIEEGTESVLPKRLTDEEWAKRLQGSTYPQPPSWTASFRLPIARPAEFLEVQSPGQGLK